MIVVKLKDCGIDVFKSAGTKHIYEHGCYSIIRRKLREDVTDKLVVCIIFGLFLILIEVAMFLYLLFSAHFPDVYDCMKI